MPDTAFLRSDELPGVRPPDICRSTAFREPTCSTFRYAVPETARSTRRRPSQLLLARAVRRPARLTGMGGRDGAASQRRAPTIDALRSRLLAPRVDRRRHARGLRRGRVVSQRARSRTEPDPHRDVEHVGRSLVAHGTPRRAAFDLTGRERLERRSASCSPLGTRGRSQKLPAERIPEPRLVLVGTPAPVDHQELVDAGMAERPDNVGCPIDIKTRSQSLLLIEALDDRSLVVVELGLNPVPEGADLRISGSGVLEDRQERAGSRLDVSRVSRVQPQLLPRGPARR